MSAPVLLKVPTDLSDSALYDMIEEAGGFASGALVEVRVAHDDDCPKLRGGGCACEPDLVVAVSGGKLP